MPGVTSGVAIHYPLDTDPIDVAGDMHTLAQDAATLIAAIKNKQDAGVPAYPTVAALHTDVASDIATVLLQGHYRLAWRDGLNWFTEYGFTATPRNTDSSSAVYIGAAECGMSTIYSATAQIAWTFDADLTPQWCASRVSSNQVQIRVWNITAFGAEALPIGAGKSITPYVQVAGRL